MAAHVEHILELLELADHLLEAMVLEHQQPDARTPAVGHRHAQDALDVERAAREEIADVAHHPGVVVHIQFQNNLGDAGLRHRVGNLFDHHQPPIISVLAAPGGTMGYTNCSRSIVAWIRHGPGACSAAASAARGSSALSRSTAGTPKPSAIFTKSGSVRYFDANRRLP